MSYSQSNPPRQIVPQGLSGDAGGVWLYSSLDPHGTVEAAGYFTGALQLGLKVGDIMVVVESDTGATTIHSVTAITISGQATNQITATATINPATFT